MCFKWRHCDLFVSFSSFYVQCYPIAWEKRVFVPPLFPHSSNWWGLIARVCNAIKIGESKNERNKKAVALFFGTIFSFSLNIGIVKRFCGYRLHLFVVCSSFYSSFCSACLVSLWHIFGFDSVSRAAGAWIPGATSHFLLISASNIHLERQRHNSREQLPIAAANRCSWNGNWMGTAAMNCVLCFFPFSFALLLATRRSHMHCYCFWSAALSPLAGDATRQTEHDSIN